MGSVLALDGQRKSLAAVRFGAWTCVERLQVVLADGSVIEADNVPINQPDADPRRGEIVRRLVDLVQRHQPENNKGQPKSCLSTWSAYHVYDILRDDKLRPADLIVAFRRDAGVEKRGHGSYRSSP